MQSLNRKAPPCSTRLGTKREKFFRQCDLGCHTPVLRCFPKLVSFVESWATTGL